MKKIKFIGILLFLFLQKTNAQTSWTGATNTSWNIASNWTSGVPGAAVDAIIGDANFTGAFQPTVNANGTCKSLTIGSGSIASTLTITRNLTVSGNVTIGSNGTILHNTASRTITLKGNWTNSGTYSATVSSALVTFSGTAQTLTGITIFQGVKVNAGSTLTLANNITVNFDLTVTGTFDPTASYAVSGTGTLTVSAAGTIVVKAADYSSNYSISGAVSLNGKATVNYASSTINQNVTNTLTYGYLRISGGMTKSLTGNLPGLSSGNVNEGRIYIDAGTLDLKTYTANRASSGGSVTIAAGASLKIGGTNTFPSNYSTISIASTGTVEYSGTNQTVLATTYGNLIFSSSSGSVVKTMPITAMIIAGNLTSSVGSGTAISFTAGANITVNRDVSLDAASTFNGGIYTHTFKGNWSNTGIFTGSTSSVTFSGTSAVLSGTGTNNFNNLTFTSVDITASNTTSITVTGNLATTGSGTFTHNAGGLLTMSGTTKTISGNGLILANYTISGSITTSANIKISGNFIVNGTFSASAGTITLSGTTKTISGSGSITFYSISILGTISTANNFIMLADISVSIAGSFTASAGTATFNGTGCDLAGTANLYNVTINIGKTLRLGTSAVLGVANTFTKTGTLNVTTNTPNTFTYNSSGAQSIVNTTYDNLILDNGGTKTAAGAITANRDLTINSGVTFDASSYIFSLYRHWTNNGTFTASTSDVQLRGANAADITGATTFYKLTENKSSTAIWVTLANNITVTNNLTMTQGNMQTGTNSVTVTGSRLGTGTGVIIGTITQNHSFTNGTTYYFEGPDNQIVFTSPSAGLTSVTVTSILGEIADFDPTREAILREYDITIPGGTYTNATLRLHYQDNELNAFDEPNLSEFKFNSGTTWDSIGFTTRNSTNNYVEKTAIPFATGIAGRWSLSGVRNVVRWTGATSSAWNTQSNWTTISGSNMSNRVPTSTDAAEIGHAAFTNNPIITTNKTVNVLRFGSVQASTLTISSGSLTTIGSIKGEWSTARSHILDVSSGTLTAGTNFDLSDGTSGHDILLKIGSGDATVNYDITQRASGGINFTGNGTLTIGGHYNYSAGSFTAGSGTVIYTGGEAQTVAPVTYNNLSFTKSTERAIINSPTIVNGNLTTSTGGELEIADTLTVAGSITIGSGNEFIETGTRINIGGDWTNNGTFTVGNGSINFNGSGSQSVNTNIFNTFIVNKSAGTLSLTGDLLLNSDLTITSGTLDLSTYTANRSNPGGTFSMGAGTFLKLAGADNFPTDYITNTLNTTSTVEYNGTIVQNVRDVDYGNITFTNGNSNPKTLIGNILMNGDMLINSGATIDASSYNHTLYGNFTNNGSYTASTSTLILNGTSKIFAGNTTLNNLTAITGSYTFTSSTLSITGDLFCDAGASLNFGNTTITHDGDFTTKGSLTSTGTLTFTGTRVQTFQLINAVISSSTGIINFNGTVAPVTNSSNSSVSLATINLNNTDPAGLTISSPWTVAVAINIAAGATLNFGALTHTFLGNFTNNGTATSSGELRFTPIAPFSSGATIRLDAAGGNFTSTGKVVFGGTQSITIVDNAPILNNVDVTNTNAAGVTPPNNWTIGQDLYVGPGAIFNSGTALSHTFASNVTNNGTLNGGTSTITFTGGAALIDGIGTGSYNNLTIATGADLTLNKSIGITGNLVNNGNFTTAGRQVTFSGTGTSTISGTTGSVTFDDLEQNKTSAVTTLSIPATVTGDLTLTNGIINTTATNILILNDNATSTSGTSTSFINGPMKKIGNDAFVFPLGNSTYWARLGIGAPGLVTDAFTAQYFAAPYANTTTMAASPTPVLNNVSVVEYWICDRTTGTSNVPVQLYWENSLRSGIGSYTSDLVVARWNGAAWENAGQASITGSNPGDVTSNSVSSFSPFAFGSKTGSVSLPIELLSFDAIPKNDHIDLEWSTATEINNDFFTIERSEDASEFFPVIVINGNGNSTKKINYKTIDPNPMAGISYYRLKQTDFDGKFSYSAIKKVNFLLGEFDFNIFPNPSNTGNTTIELKGKEGDEILVVLYDTQGKEVYTKVQFLSKTGETQIFLDLANKLPSGIYFVVASSDNKMINKKLIIK
jgi:hypothetical protein